MTSHWRHSAPVIAGDKVVFTAPDEGSVHCLNLRDGTLLWKAQRDDDLYLAGVYGGKVLLVGKDGCRALDVANGRQVWKLETGVPSGMGVAAGNVYYLPMRLSAETKEAGICAINIAKGRIVATVNSGKEAPGNLVLHDGQLLSQTATAITAFPLRKE
jgi:outer membrane protein assembly factor BamB